MIRFFKQVFSKLDSAMLLISFLLYCSSSTKASYTHEDIDEDMNWNQNHEALHFLGNVRKQVIDFQKRMPRTKPCHYFPIDSRKEFYNRLYSQIANLHMDFIHFYNPCMSSYNLGNCLGNYFNEISCAASTNTSLIIGKKLWDFPTMPYEYKGRSRGPIGNAPTLASHNMALFDALPEVFDSSQSYVSRILALQNQSDFKSVKELYSEIDSLKKRTMDLCPCEKYCWSESRAPWINHHLLIRKILGRAINFHHHSVLSANASIRTELQDSDMCTSPSGQHCTSLPLIPDVVIHYRCGDTVPSTTYGFLPFAALKQIIDFMPATIYVLTDPAIRTSIMSHNNKFQKNCRPILQALFDYMKATYPSATIIVKAGGDPFLDYVRLSRAKITICSASTFCLWPAIAAKGKAYFPVSSLVAGWNSATKVNDLPYLGKHFNWVDSPRIITSFQENSLLELVLRTLHADSN